MEKSYRYIGYYFILFVPLIIAAFFRTYLVKFPDFDVTFSKLLHVHAVIASLWVAMLIAQPFLIVYKKNSWHRAIGKLSYVVFPLLILSFAPKVWEKIHAGNYQSAFFAIGDASQMTLLYSLAIYYRKDIGRHMRYIVGSSIPLLGPTVGRILPIYFHLGDIAAQTLQYAIMFGILLGFILYDRKNGKNYQPYVVAASAIAACAVVFYIMFL